jgi:hypothetical protein
MQFSPLSCHLIPLRSKHPLCYSLNVRDQVSHPYRTIHKIIVLYNLIFTFFDRRRENTTLWTKW